MAGISNRGEIGRLVTYTDYYQEMGVNYWYDDWEAKYGPPTESNETLWIEFYQNYKP